jgi:hypothetical protein
MTVPTTLALLMPAVTSVSCRPVACCPQRRRAA